MTGFSELILTRETEATIIPAGDVQLIPAGTKATISQALGGSVTIRTSAGLFRLASRDWDALGREVQEDLKRLAEENADQSDTESAFSESKVWDAMRRCYDPEIPVNIVDLGLIYDLQCTGPDSDDQYSVAVKMTLTAQGCGMGPVIAEDAKKNIEQLADVKRATVDIVWEPAWTPHMISDAGREKLGLDA